MPAQNSPVEVQSSQATTGEPLRRQHQPLAVKNKQTKHSRKMPRQLYSQVLVDLFLLERSGLFLTLNAQSTWKVLEQGETQKARLSMVPRPSVFSNRTPSRSPRPPRPFWAARGPRREQMCQPRPSQRNRARPLLSSSGLGKVGMTAAPRSAVEAAGWGGGTALSPQARK